MQPATVDPAERIRRAQERALRAARAVTLTMTAALAGCSSSVTVGVADVPAAESPGDAPAADVVAEADAGVVAEADAGGDAAADAGESCSIEGDAAGGWAECCRRINWDWNRGCQAWGPFMPPSMEG